MWTTAVLMLALGGGPAEESPYLAAAREVARWLQASAIADGEGKLWPPDPEAPAARAPHLYGGTPGVVLFFLELADATGEEVWLTEARAGANHLIARLDEIQDQTGGLYTGLAGTAFALAETHRATGDERFRAAARRLVERLHTSARPAGAGAEWSEVTDVVGGGAGTGLFLLWAARQLDHPASLELAARAGRRLVELGEPAGGGLSWSMSPDFPRRMPNFSHGTAGVAYFLARLAEETGDETFREAARAGARYLDSLAVEEHGGYLVFHHQPGGEDLFYLGWCHGPAGTGRLFDQLWRLTGDESYRRRLHAAARSVLASGIPERRTPGFWNNVGQCCGSAGVAEFFLSLAQGARQPERYATFARQLLDDVLARGTKDERGLRWVQAEHRVRPELLQAQTGYMQGAAGVGMALLHLDGALTGRPPRIVLPDSPHHRDGWRVLPLGPSGP